MPSLFVILLNKNSISFGWNFGSMDSMEGESPLGHTFDSMVSICSKRALNPVWRIKEWMTGTDKKLQSGQRFVAEHMASIIQKRREQGFHGGKKDLLQLFLEATDDDGNPLSDSVIQDFIVNITVAGIYSLPIALYFPTSWMDISNLALTPHFLWSCSNRCQNYRSRCCSPVFVLDDLLSSPNWQ